MKPEHIEKAKDYSHLCHLFWAICVFNYIDDPLIPVGLFLSAAGCIVIDCDAQNIYKIGEELE